MHPTNVPYQHMLSTYRFYLGQQFSFSIRERECIPGGFEAPFSQGEERRGKRGGREEREEAILVSSTVHVNPSSNPACRDFFTTHLLTLPSHPTH